MEECAFVRLHIWQEAQDEVLGSFQGTTDMEKGMIATFQYDILALFFLVAALAVGQIGYAYKSWGAWFVLGGSLILAGDKLIRMFG